MFTLFSYYKRVFVIGDGNCLFRSLAIAVFGLAAGSDDTQMLRLRLRASEHLPEFVRTQGYDFKSLLSTMLNDGSSWAQEFRDQFHEHFGEEALPSVEDYADWMANSGVWGSELEIGVLAQLYDLRTFVCMPGIGVYEVSKGSIPVILVYESGHYNVLLEKSEAGDKTTWIQQKITAFVSKEKPEWVPAAVLNPEQKTGAGLPGGSVLDCAPPSYASVLMGTGNTSNASVSMKNAAQADDKPAPKVGSAAMPNKGSAPRKVKTSTGPRSVGARSNVSFKAAHTSFKAALKSKPSLVGSTSFEGLTPSEAQAIKAALLEMQAALPDCTSKLCAPSASNPRGSSGTEVKDGSGEAEENEDIIVLD